MEQMKRAMAGSMSGKAAALRSGALWTAVLFLMLVGIFNIIDRSLPLILVEPIKRDLQLSDTEIGLINGFGFLIVYALIGLPIARLSDRGHYGLVISVCLALWSAMTLLGAAAQTGWQLALTRMGVAVGEAGSSPAAHAFISRNFKPTRRSTPLAVLALSVPFATMSANIGGGLIGTALGWRATFGIMGVAGLLLAPFALLLLRSGPREGSPPLLHAPAPAARGAVLALLRKPSFALILAGTAALGIAGYSLGTFAFAFMIRVHGLTLAEMGVRYGILVGVLGVVTLLITAFAADRLSARDPRWALWTVAAVIALVVPFSFAALLVGDATLALLCLVVANVATIVYTAPVVAALHRLVPPELRATTSAILLLCMSLFGGLGPFLTGMISDALQPTYGAAALGYAMMVLPVGQALAAICYFAAARTFRRDMVEEGGEPS